MRRAFVVVAVTLAGAACGGGAGGNVGAAAPPVASSSQAAREFMRAAADSNMVRMGQLWGSSKGPAGVVGSPPDYERILVVIQAYIRGDSARVTSDVGVAGDDKRRRLGMTLYRGTCVRQIPMTMIKMGNGGWIVNNVDVASAGNPARPCDPNSEPPKP